MLDTGRQKRVEHFTCKQCEPYANLPKRTAGPRSITGCDQRTNFDQRIGMKVVLYLGAYGHSRDPSCSRDNAFFKKDLAYDVKHQANAKPPSARRLPFVTAATECHRASTPESPSL